MTRVILLSITIGGLMLTNSASAQDYCDQVRQAVATYGYAAAKKHAMEHYTKEEVEAADKCVRPAERGVVEHAPVERERVMTHRIRRHREHERG